MCGIYGEVRFGVERRDPWRGGNLGSALACLRHRGPDASGSVEAYGPGWSARLAHARLKIIDLSDRAAQPMASPDGRYELVFNGEIYNYRALREELRGQGRSFRSESDTEVLLAALETWGEKILPRLEGIFAFTLLDRNDGSLLVARDAFGVKPLYYATVPGGVAISSELRCLLRALDMAVRVAEEGIASFLAFGSVYGPGTVVEGVCELRPGHLLHLTRQGVETRKWYTLSFDRTREPVDAGDSAREVRRLLAGAVERQLVSDVPLGVFLSGGMDSSALLAIAALTHRDAITAITVAFDDDLGSFNEDAIAAKFAQGLGVRHEVLRLREDWLLGSLDAVLASMDQPSVDGVNTWAVSRAVKDAGITVALSGLGGDEVFGGYSSLRHAFEWGRVYTAMRMLGGLSHACGTAAGWFLGGGVGSRKASALLRHSRFPGGAYAVRRALFLPEDAADLVTPQVARLWKDKGLEGILYRTLPSGLPPAQEATVLEIENYMAFTTLRDTDVMSMAHALEVRVPFLDRLLVEYVLALPLEVRFQKGKQKPLLAAAVPEILQIVAVPKRGFTLPFEKWLVGPLRATVEGRLRTLHYTGQWIRPEGASKLFGEFVRGDTRLWSRVWGIYVLDRWMEGMTVGPEV